MDISNDMEVPEKLPAIFIKAKDRKEAIKILLEVFNAKENPSNQEVLIEWLEVENIDIQEVNIESVNVVGETIESEPSEEDLIGEEKNKPATMKITFKSPEQLQKAEIDIQELLDRKYNGAFFSVSAGEL
jgi:hypothetical protein